MIRKWVAVGLAALSMNIGVVSQSVSAPVDFIDQGNYTTDTISGLDWLDLTETIGQSILVVRSQLAIGGLLEGWRVASNNEFEQMVSNWAGVAYGSDTAFDFPAGDASAGGLVNLLGATQVGNDVSYAHGFFNQSIYAGQGRQVQLTAAIVDYSDPAAQDNAYDRYVSYFTFQGISHVGTYLVRETEYSLSTVPLPAALPLYGAGLAVLGFFGWKRRRQEA